MGCDACTDKEKQIYLDKLIADAKKQAQEKQEPVAICKGPEGDFLLNAFEAYRTRQIVVDVISHLQPSTA